VKSGYITVHMLTLISGTTWTHAFLDNNPSHTHTSCTPAANSYPSSALSSLLSTMSHTSTHHVSICKKFKESLLPTSQPSALASILDTVVQASSPYPALRRRVKRLSKVLKKVEVGDLSSQSCIISSGVFTGQEAVNMETTSPT